jgi:TRAP-type mannitol/chloroaromatic compound transport system permease small subunit
MAADDSPSTPPHSTVETDFLPHTELPDTRVSRALDRGLQWFGYGLSWLWLGVVGVILAAVIGRYVFGTSSVMMEEIEWHLSGAIWLVGLSYALTTDHHVRVDVLHERFGLKTQAWIELLGIVVLLLPFCWIAVDTSADFFWSSWQQGEVSNSPGGLPARYVIKFFIPLAFFLIAVAGIARVLKCTALLFGWPRPIAVQSDR